ncbi:MAG: pseudouridine synthase [Nitrospinota bacterium]
MRLVKWLAGAGVASRRGAGELVLSGRVKVNGRVVQEPWLDVDPSTDRVNLDGKAVRPPVSGIYVLLYKPRGCVTTRRDPQGRPTVMDCLKGLKAPVLPVGRLDFDAEGVLLLTTDGVLAHRLTHPRFGVERTYRVKVRGVPDQLSLRRLSRGIHLPDGKAVAERVRLESRLARAAWLQLTVREGRSHLIKRMCETMGHPVLKLRRTRFAGLTLAGLRTKEWRYLTDPEVKGLRRLTGLEKGSR